MESPSGPFHGWGPSPDEHDRHVLLRDLVLPGAHNAATGSMAEDTLESLSSVPAVRKLTQLAVLVGSAVGISAGLGAFFGASSDGGSAAGAGVGAGGAMGTVFLAGGNYARKLVRKIVFKLARCQAQPLHRLLFEGVRYFDLRAVVSADPEQPAKWHHGGVQWAGDLGQVTNSLQLVAEGLADPEMRDQVVLLHFSHWLGSMEYADHERFWLDVEAVLQRDTLALRSDDVAQASLNEQCFVRGRPVVVLADYGVGPNMQALRDGLFRRFPWLHDSTKCLVDRYVPQVKRDFAQLRQYVEEELVEWSSNKTKADLFRKLQLHYQYETTLSGAGRFVWDKAGSLARYVRGFCCRPKPETVAVPLRRVVPGTEPHLSSVETSAEEAPPDHVARSGAVQLLWENGGAAGVYDDVVPTKLNPRIVREILHKNPDRLAAVNICSFDFYDRLELGALLDGLGSVQAQHEIKRELVRPAWTRTSGV